MRRHLNTLYVTSEGAWLNKDSENVVVSVDGVERGRVPIHTIGSIVGFGRVLMPTAPRRLRGRRHFGKLLH
jgi:CRISP-associated protein Cas1